MSTPPGPSDPTATPAATSSSLDRCIALVGAAASVLAVLCTVVFGVIATSYDARMLQLAEQTTPAPSAPVPTRPTTSPSAPLIARPLVRTVAEVQRRPDFGRRRGQETRNAASRRTALRISLSVTSGRAHELRRPPALDGRASVPVVIRPGDMVLLNQRGRVFHAHVRSVPLEGRFQIAPIERDVRARSATSATCSALAPSGSRPRPAAIRPAAAPRRDHFVTL